MHAFRWSMLAPVVTGLILLGSTGRSAGQTPAVTAEVLLNTAEVDQRQAQAWKEILYTARVVDQTAELLGATLQPISESLRAQLGVPAGQGLLVASIREDGPSAQAGLKQNDILLTLADKPLASADDVSKQLKASGEAAAALKILRSGKPVTLQVRPIYRVTLGAAEEPKPEYYIGISIDPADDALRAQLDLPTNQGVIVLDVVNGSPAEKAGLKKHDVLLELGGKPIENPQVLTGLVQAAKDKPNTVKLLREGKPMTLAITGASRKPQQANAGTEAFRVWLVDQPTTANAPGFAFNPTVDYARYVNTMQVNTVAQRLDQVERDLKALRRLEEVEKQVKALNAAVEKLTETLRSDKAKK